MTPLHTLTLANRQLLLATTGHGWLPVHCTAVFSSPDVLAACVYLEAVHREMRGDR